MKNETLHWIVIHEDHDPGLHGPAPRFDSEEKAKAACERWNRDMSGHSVFFVPPSPPEFSSLPNVKVSQPHGDNL